MPTSCSNLASAICKLSEIWYNQKLDGWNEIGKETLIYCLGLSLDENKTSVCSNFF